MRILLTIFTSFEINPTRDKRDKRKIASAPILIARGELYAFLHCCCTRSAGLQPHASTEMTYFLLLA